MATTVDRTPLDQATYGSDLMVELLARLGYRYVALNPGATFRGLHDSLVNAPGGLRILTATHEEIAVAIAHGYAKAAGRPMAAAVHDVVGLQHASMAIYNAWCDQAPILVLGGTGPVDASRRRPYIDWVHTALVQGSLVRDYVKWDDQPASLASALESLTRADRILRAEPPGPVYVCLDVDLQEAAAEAAPMAAPPLPAPPARLAPDPDAIRQAAESLVAARHPVAIADMLGRDWAAVPDLVRLAEHLAMPVIDAGGRLNFPTEHPLDATDALDTLHEPDVILALDVVDLDGQLRRLARSSGGGRARPAARVIHITTRELSIRSWAAGYQALAPVDLSIPAAVGPAVSGLLLECLDRARPIDADERGRQRAAAHGQRRTAWRREADDAGRRAPIAMPWLFLRLHEALADRPWSLVNGPIESPWPRRLLAFREPWQFLGGSGGAGIGYAAGASVGAALALHDRGVLAVDVQGDGDFLYTPGSVWTAVHERIPLLIVIANNRSYYNSEAHARSMARLRSRPLSHASIGTRLADPIVDFAALARSMGAIGLGPVLEPDELGHVLTMAVDAVADGGVVVVDVVCEPR